MQKVIVSEGIKTSLPNIINKSQDVFELNYRELIGTLYSPGFFIARNSNGTLQDDWKPERVQDENGDYKLLRINTRGTNPAKCYIASGKVISLNATYTFSPVSVNSVTINNQGNSEQSDGILPSQQSGTYELYIVPLATDQVPVDYLPNYKASGETKYLVTDYQAGVLVVKKSSTRQVSVDGIKLAEFTLDTNGVMASNPVDFRTTNRAFIKPELYEYFIANYLKHDFVLTTGDDNLGSVYLNFDTSYNLKGTFTLYGVKDKTSKITVKFDDSVGYPKVNVPINSVIYITVSENDFFQTSVLEKTLQVIPIADFLPSVDTIVLGYHVKVEVPGILPEEEL